MKRGSFFGRLSRANDLATEPEAQAAPQSDVVVMERAKAEQDEPVTPPAPTPPTPAPAEPAPLPSTPPAPAAPEKPAETPSEDDWDAEVEGQLTIDVYQTTDSIVIKSTIAGVSPEDLDISIDNDMITIQGERENVEEVKEKDYYYQECYWGSFSRSVILPCDVRADETEAELKNGILTVRLPKANATKAKRIEVHG